MYKYKPSKSILKSHLKHIAILCISIITLNVCATNYYLSSSTGDDNYNGTITNSPWQSINQLNSKMADGTIQPGDNIFLKRGDTFSGTLKITVSNVAFSTFGNGVKPVIDAGTPLTNWTEISNNTWQTSCQTCTDDVRMLTINDEFQHFARFPNSDATNKGYLTYESHTDENSITDYQLSNSPNWTGAELVVRNRRWKLDRSIVQHNGNTLSLNTPLKVEPKNNYGYFFQNHLAALDQNGEFVYEANSKTFTLKSSINPNGSAKTSHTNYAVILDNVASVTINNFHFTGANLGNVYIDDADNISLINCTISEAATNGIYARQSYFINIENCKIENIQNNGIDIRSNEVTISGSTVKNIGLTPGMGQSYDGQYNAVSVIGNKVNISNNRVENVGYLGITFRGNDVLISNNFVQYFCLVKDDGAGIYTYNNAVNTGIDRLSNQRIEGNIVLNGTGAKEGTPTPFDFSNNFGKADGIYIDDGSDDIIIANNICANNSQSGIHIHHAGTIQMRNNVLYNNKLQIFLSDDANERQDIRDNVFENNCAISANNNQYSNYSKTLWGNEIPLFGIFKNNYYAPSGNSANFLARTSNGTNTYTLPAWQQATGLDENSTIVQPGPYIFLYNHSNTVESTSLNGNYKDVKGNLYAGTINLEPWTAAVLIEVSLCDEVVADFWQFEVDDVTENSIKISWQENGSHNFQIHWKEEPAGNWQNEIVTNNTFTITNLNAGTLYRVTQKDLCRDEFTESKVITTLLPPVDNDGDGITEENDCNDNDANIGAIQTEGTSCNDNDPDTLNDTIQADGCTCAGKSASSCNHLITIRAKGDYGLEEMKLKINGEFVETWIVSDTWDDYSFYNNKAVYELQVHLTNHDYVAGSIDYNLNVDYVTIGRSTYQTNASNNYGKGVRIGNNYCVNGNGFTKEKLFCIGYFEYDFSNNITIKAKGDYGEEKMTLQINGEDVKAWITPSNWQEYTLSYDGVIHQLRVFLSNHQYVADSIDYNLNIDYVNINSNTIETNAPENYGIGVKIDGNFCNQGNNFTVEKLFCPGYIEYIDDCDNGLDKLQTLKQSEISVYPNPAKDNLNIVLKDINKFQNINLYSTAGKHLWSTEGVTTNEIKIPLNQFSTGMYILNIQLKDGTTITDRIIKN